MAYPKMNAVTRPKMGKIASGIHRALPILRTGLCAWILDGGAIMSQWQSIETAPSNRVIWMFALIGDLPKYAAGHVSRPSEPSNMEWFWPYYRTANALDALPSPSR
jgi:hypothetical protein